VTFWGGGVDYAKDAPLSDGPTTSPAGPRAPVGIFNPGGGFVFNTIHNVQAGVPVENLLANVRCRGRKHVSAFFTM